MQIYKTLGAFEHPLGLKLPFGGDVFEGNVLRGSCEAGKLGSCKVGSGLRRVEETP